MVILGSGARAASEEVQRPVRCLLSHAHKPRTDVGLRPIMGSRPVSFACGAFIAMADVLQADLLAHRSSVKRSCPVLVDWPELTGPTSRN